VHGKKDGLERLVHSFHERHPTLTKNGLKRKILEIAERKKPESGSGSVKWMVKDDFLRSVAGSVVAQVSDLSKTVSHV
jgi:hypothetical protein